MGCYDTFLDGEKEVQLKSFQCAFLDYEAGEDLGNLLKTFNYPPTATFFCESYPDLFVHFEDGVFTIIDATKKFPLFTCDGEEISTEKSLERGKLE